MISLKHIAQLATCLFTVAIIYGADQAPTTSNWTRSVFAKFINHHKMQKGEQTVIDRRTVALDSIEDELKKPKKGFLGWIQSFWSKPLYDAPILMVESEIDREAQAKAIAMAEKGGYLEPHRNKKGRSEKSHREESEKFERYQKEMDRDAAWTKVRKELAARGDIEPDPFLKFNVQTKTVGDLLQVQRNQVPEGTRTGNISINDKRLDYKLGRT